ncbi:hypothetical protein [Mangrovibacterium diazotrophicum]|uniref:hypothetical protein n=1 Tax=Mangrovibacterium diazotrophicum TaxID=1261403 RepID=UPI001473035E|nr:hypothetical protein [Mangrovibacterium diazotrophicum]
MKVTDATDVQTMLTTLLKYNNTFGKHSLNLLAGYQEKSLPMTGRVAIVVISLITHNAS